MAEQRKNQARRKIPPATTPEARENQLIAKAVNLAERQLENGTATAQVITHYLKLGTTRERLEQERIRNENLLLTAKVENIASSQRVEELYKNALKAMKTYSGGPEDDEDEEPVLY